MIIKLWKIFEWIFKIHVCMIPHAYVSPLSVDDTTGITQDGR